MMDRLPPDNTRRKRAGATPLAASPDPNQILDPTELVPADEQLQDEDEDQSNARRRAFLELNQPALPRTRDSFLGN